jgi:phage baseplate assembly protein W
MSQYLGSITKKRTIQSDYLGKISRSFKDISLNFTRNPVTDDIVILKNEEAIKQSVKNLILTKVNERRFNPLVGTDTTSYLFELSTGVSSNALIEQIESVLIDYEPRINLVSIEVNPPTTESTIESGFEVIIEYEIVGLPQEVQNLSFILVRES